MIIKINWSFVKGEADTKKMKLVALPAFPSKHELDAALCIQDGWNLQIASIHTGDIPSSNALCEEIARRFNEFPEELKK